MDLTLLEALGKVAGIGGIAIGVVVLIIRGVIAKTSTLSVRQRPAMLRLVAIGAFGIGALGIVAWITAGASSGLHASTGGADLPAVVSGGNVTIGPASPGSAPPGQTGVVPNATAKTEGNRSPAIISGGDVVVTPQNNSQRPNTP